MSDQYLYAGGDIRVSAEPGTRGHRIKWEDPHTGLRKDAVRKHLNDALSFAEDLAAVLDGEPVADAQDVTVEEVAELFCDGDTNGLRYSPSTVQNKAGHMRKYVLPALGDMQVSDVTAAHINRCLDTYQGEQSGEKQLLYSISALVGWANQRGYDFRPDLFDNVKSLPNPSRSVQAEDIPTRYAIDMAAKQAAQIPTRWHRDGNWWRQLEILLPAWCGTRPSETRALAPRHINFDTGEIRVERQFHKVSREMRDPKYDSKRFTVLPPDLEDDLARRCEEVDDPDLPLFPLESDPTGWCDISNYDKMWFKRATAAVPEWTHDWTQHSLRHFFCSHMINELGVPVAAVSKMAGHSKKSVTHDLYVADVADATERARDAMRNG